MRGGGLAISLTPQGTPRPEQPDAEKDRSQSWAPRAGWGPRDCQDMQKMLSLPLSLGTRIELGGTTRQESLEGLPQKGVHLPQKRLASDERRVSAIRRGE